MNHIGSHVTQIMHNCNHEHAWKFVIIKNWDNIMGNMANKVSIQKISHNALTLTACDSSWVHELHLLSELIKTKINELLGSQKIQAIKLKCAATNAKKISAKTQTQKINLKPVTLTHQEQQALQKIQDQELRQALQGFLQKCHHSS